MLRNSKNKNLKYVFGRSRKILNFSKIMLVSCTKVSLNRYKLTYLMNYSFVCDDAISLLSRNIYLDYDDFNKIIKFKFGVWLDYKNFDLRNFNYFVYCDNSGSLIYKSIKHDNRLSLGDHNSYKHKLIYKALISDNFIIEE